MRLLLKNGRVVDPASGTDDTLDILIDGELIVEIKDKIEARDARLIDASRLVVAPGFIDMHVHLREPGQEHKETIETGTRAAAKGGFTSICCMPNTLPVNDSRKVTRLIKSRAAKNALVNVFPIAAITTGLQGAELTDMAGLTAAGAIAFSDDGNCVQNTRLMRSAMERAKALKALIIDHCEDRFLFEGGVIHDGPLAKRLKVGGIPSACEEIMVARDIILAESLETRIHIAHLSTRGSARLVREAKKRGIHVTAEATPHHLLLTDDRLENRETAYKVNPPLRGAEDLRAMIEAVKDGTIDVFATDHAPHAAKEKALSLEKAPFGMTGLETAVSLLYDRIVGKNVISLARFIEMCSTRPAALLGLASKGRIAVGADADLTILNLHQDFVVDAGAFESKCRISPYDGWKLRGAPAMTVVGGKIVYPFGS